MPKKKTGIDPHRVVAGHRRHLKQTRMDGLRAEKENLVHNARRHRAAARFRERALRAAVSGVDWSAIERQQQRDIATMEKFAREQRAKLMAAAKRRAARQKKLRDAMAKRHERLSRFRGNPLLVGCVIAATEIDDIYAPASVGTVDRTRSQPFQQSIARFDNRAEVDLSVYTSGNNVGSDNYLIDFMFVWPQPSFSASVGILHPLAELHLNGGWQLEAFPRCGDASWARVRVATVFAVSQTTPSGTPQQSVSSGQVVLLDERREGANSVGYVWNDALLPWSDTTNLETPPMEIVPDAPVLFRVTFALSAGSAGGAGADLDLRSGPYEINIPAIAFTVEY